jgi:EAL domain-containing protein (putative c-di-GMP-specific phosphodiesterase class I)
MEATATPFGIQGQELQLTVSAGAGIHPKDGEDFEALLRSAETARNDAKASGGNRFHCYASEMTRETSERMELETALRAAIERGELHMHYQPQIDIATGRVAGAEALMRWKHPQRGWIPPAKFIPVAEESDLIMSLGEWALLRAAEQLARWRREGAAPMRVAVNVSARQFRDPGFVEAAARAVRAIGGDPAGLEIELTESVVIEDPKRVSATLQELRGLGIGIAVDDFGTGYSSLGYLSSLPVDCLKIDRGFVGRIAQGGRDIAIIRAIISLSHGLRMRVIAEGVETGMELEFLGRHGCNEAQGFYFSPAVDAAAFQAFTKAGALAPAAKGDR